MTQNFFLKRHNFLLSVVLVFFILQVSSICNGQCSLKRGTGEGGIPLLTLENSFVRMVISPEQGGACTSFLARQSGQEFTPGTQSGRNRGMFQEFINGYEGDWVGAPYELEVLSNGPDEVAVRLSRQGSSAVLQYCRFTKTIRMRRDSSIVSVEENFLNQHESMAEINVPLRFMHNVQIMNKVTDYYVPTKDGVKTYTYPPQGGTVEPFTYDVPRGWIAGVEKGGKAGFAYDLETSYKYLMCLYQWFGDSFPLVEWMFRTQKLANGESLSFTYSFIPFEGLANVDGVGGGIVSGFEGLGDAKVSGQKIAFVVKNYFGEAKQGTLHLQARRLGDKTSIAIGSKKITAKAGEVIASDLGFSPAQDGTYVIAGEFKADGKVVHEFERSIVVGKPSGKYTLEAREKRLGDPNELFTTGKPALTSNPEKDPLEWSGGVVTPHVKWAKPYEKGKIRALVLCSYFTGREVLELAQRMDLDLVTGTIETSAVDTWTPWWLHGGNGAYTQAKVAELLKGKYDVIVFGGLDGGLYTKEITELLAKQVRSGTGLVYIDPRNMPQAIQTLLPGKFITSQPYGIPDVKGRWNKAADHFVTQGIPFEVLPETLYWQYKPEAGASALVQIGDDPLVMVRETPGMGRTVLLSYINSFYGGFLAGLTPYFRTAPATTLPYWEYYYSLLARCITWAAEKEPAVDFTGKATTGGIVEINLDNKADGFKGALDIDVIDRYGREVLQLQKELPVGSGTSKTALDLSKEGQLTAGLHVANIVLRRDGKAVNWGAVPFDVKQPAWIERIDMPEKIYQKGETVEASVLIKGQTSGLRVQADLIDSYDRVVDSQVIATGQKGTDKLDLKFIMPEPLSTAHTLRVRVWQGDVLLDDIKKDLLAMPTTFRDRQWQDWEFSGWDDGPQHNPHIFKYKAKAYRDAGLTSLLFSTVAGSHWAAGLAEHERAFRLGFKVSPATFMSESISVRNFNEQKANYAKTKDKKYLHRNPSLSDPEFRKNVKTSIQKELVPLIPFAPMTYCYSDEISITLYTYLFDFDFSPAAIKDFRVWLKGQYGTLDTLNAEWDTAFKSWDDVMPMTMEEVKDRANKAPWADHRTFMEYVNADFYSYMGNALREVDPKAMCGISGTQAPATSNGMDYSRLTKTFDFLDAYIGYGMLEIQRSFRHLPMSAWNGYGRPDEFLTYEAWVTFLHNYNGVMYYHLRHFLNPNLTPTRDALELSRIVGFLNKGIARLVRNAKRQSQVAIHYSQPSVHLAGLEGKQEGFMNIRVGWLDMLEDMGFQGDFLASKEICDGDLDRYSVLILPYSCAISRKEAQAIKEFVKRGGLLLADADTGIYDEHGKPYPNGVLNDVFGIARGSKAADSTAIVGDMEFRTDYKNSKFKGRNIYANIAGPDVKTNGGKALTMLKDKPAFIVNSYGKGYAVYLNVLPSSYSNSRKRGGGVGFREIMRQVFRLCDVSSPVKVMGTKIPLDVCQVVQFDAGPAEYVGILQDYRNPKLKPGAARIVFPDIRNVYDAVEGKYMGKTKEIQALISPGQARIFSRLDYKVDSVTAEMGPSFARGAEVKYEVKVNVSDGKQPGLHVVNVEVFDPDGKLCNYYTQNVDVKDGRGQGSFRLAQNDKLGKWRLRLRDAATGVVAEKEFIVSE